MLQNGLSERLLAFTSKIKKLGASRDIPMESATLHAAANSAATKERVARGVFVRVTATVSVKEAFCASNSVQRGISVRMKGKTYIFIALEKS